MGKRQGLLFALGNKTLGTTYNQLQERSRALASDARAFAYWTTGEKGGRFTNLAAIACKVFIQSAIDGKHPEVTGGTDFKSLTTNRYEKWKASQNYGSTPWKRTGQTSEAFEVRKGKIGKKTIAWVSVNPKALTPQIGFSGQQTGFVKAKDVIKWLEFGTVHMSARPMVSAAIQRFVALNFPGMVDSIRESFVDWIKANNMQSKSSKESMGSMGSAMGSYSAKGSDESVANSNPKSDFSESQIKQVLSGGGMQTEEISTSRMNKNENNILLKSLRSSGLSSEEINRIMEGMKDL